MAAPKGHPRYGGRQVGSRNKCLVKRDQALAQAYAAAMASRQAEHVNDLTPLEAMLLCMQWSIQAKDRVGILAAASAAAPYIHPRLSAGTLQVTHDFAKMSDEQLLIEATALESKLTLIAHQVSQNVPERPTES